MTDAVTGVVLAGGLGRRLGARSKPGMLLAGRPLIARPIEALAGACAAVAIVCKTDTELPELPEGVARWDEPDEPRHPLTGIIHALERAGGAVLVCAADMPYVDARSCRRLLSGARAEPEALAVVPQAGGRIQPIFAVYGSGCLGPFRGAPRNAPLSSTVSALDPVRLALPPEILRGVNTPSELAEAEAELGGATAGARGRSGPG